MEINWIKTRKEITPEKIENAAKDNRNKSGKVKIRKGKSSHEKAKKLAERPVD